MEKEILVITYAIDEELDKPSILEAIDKHNAETDLEFRNKPIRRLISKLSSSRMRDKEVVLCKTGVGKLNSTVKLQCVLDNTMKFCTFHGIRPKITVLNLGTAASALEETGVLAECRRFIDRDIVRLSDTKYVCERDWLLGDTSDYSSEGNHRLRYSCNTGDRFVTDAEDAHQMRDGWIAVCDMEAFPQKRLCDLYSDLYSADIKFVCTKFITDKIGDNSIKAWEEWLPEAREELTRIAIYHILNE